MLTEFALSALTFSNKFTPKQIALGLSVFFALIICILIYAISGDNTDRELIDAAEKIKDSKEKVQTDLKNITPPNKQKSESKGRSNAAKKQDDDSGTL